MLLPLRTKILSVKGKDSKKIQNKITEVKQSPVILKCQNLSLFSFFFVISGSLTFAGTGLPVKQMLHSKCGMPTKLSIWRGCQALTQDTGSPGLLPRLKQPFLKAGLRHSANPQSGGGYPAGMSNSIPQILR